MARGRWLLAAAAAVAAVAASLGGVARAQASAENETIIQYLQADERFTILVALLEDAGLLEQLNSTSANYTLFAPTDQAINATISRQESQNITSPYNLTQILQYHIVPGDFSRVNFTNTAPPGDSLVVVPPVVSPSAAPTATPTAACTCPTTAPKSTGAAARGAASSTAGSGSGYAYNEDEAAEDAASNPTNLTSITLKTLLHLDSLDHQPQRIKALGTSELSVEFANNVTVTEPDIQVVNGYIQIIDGLLEPPGNVTVVAGELAARNFSLWVDLVARLNLTDLFDQDNSTVFLPIELSYPNTASNESLLDMGESDSGSGEAAVDSRQVVQKRINAFNDSEWRSILELMVVPSAVLYTDELAAMLVLPTSSSSSSSSSSPSSAPSGSGSSASSANASEVASFTTAADTTLNISVASSGEAYQLTTDDDQTATIVRDARLFDVPTQSGVLHIISRILLPAGLVGPATALERALAAVNATKFAQALSSAGLITQVSQGNYTLFAPTDEAFEEFNSTGQSLTNVVDVHVVPGEPAVVNGAELIPLDQNATLLINHDQVAFTVRVLEVAKSFANIIRNATNARNQIYVIDHVLTPPPA